MAYTPTQWSPGDSITSAKLNKIENGIANNNGGIFWVTGTVSEGSSSGGAESGFSSPSVPLVTLNKTMREIIEAGESKIVVIKFQPTSSYLTIDYYSGYGYRNNTYSLFTSSSSAFTFYAASLDDYPTNQEPSSDDSGGTIVK